MKIKDNFDTDIEYLVKACDTNTVFLSDWNKHNSLLDFPEDIAAEAVKHIEERNSYVFSEEIDDLKAKYAIRFSDYSANVDPMNFTVVSNGTIGGFLLLNSVRKALHGDIHALILSPTYFAYINILKEFGAEVDYIQAKLEEEKITDIYEIECELKANGYNLLVITDPLFGTGLSIGIEDFQELADFCEEHQIYFFIDNVYGGMRWNEKPEILDYEKVKIATTHEYVMLLESMSKRVFLNGIKNALIFANEKIIHDAETCATLYAGSIAYSQIEMFQLLYGGRYDDRIKKHISNIADFCAKNYELVQRELEYCSLKVLPCSEGFFCLVGIPLTSFECNENEIMDEIMYRHNILVISQNRYLYEDNEYFYFRLNLTINESSLKRSLQVLVDNYG